MEKYKKVYKDYVAAFICLIVLNFMLPRLLPGDPVTALIGDQALFEMTDEMYKKLVVDFGLDQPLYIQFFKYIKGLIQFDFGYSYFHKKKVIDLIFSYIPWTILLVTTSMFFSLLIGYLTGIESGYHHGKRLDKYLLSVMIFISGFPQFFLGMLFLIFFSVQLGWFPMGGCETACSDFTGIRRIQDILMHLILPVITIVIAEVSNMYLLTRNTSIIVRKKYYMRTAVAKGLGEYVMKHRYLGKNSFIPLLTMAAIIMGRMFVGALLIEVVFSYPGLGSLIYEAVQVRDYPVLQGTFFMVATMVLIFNGIAEGIHLKYSERR
ncbi:MAG: ABC transporter permease [Marinisporobacter sp.]|jgi:peptide/nickel transport system permease protein|nr:ABC transporter permease [Marinisporobacter sp.]